MDAGTIIAGIAAAISLGSIAAQYLLLPKPLLVIEDIHHDGYDVVMTLRNRGSGPAYAVWEGYNRRGEESGWHGFEWSPEGVGTLEPGEGQVFHYLNEFGGKATFQWRQAPFLFIRHRKKWDTDKRPKRPGPGMIGRNRRSDLGPARVIYPNHPRTYRAEPEDGRERIVIDPEEQE